jgi:hypothetical protein
MKKICDNCDIGCYFHYQPILLYGIEQANERYVEIAMT